MVLLYPGSAAVTESAAISKISRIIGAFPIYKFGVLELGAFGGRFHDDYTWRIFLPCQSKFLFGILKTALLYGNPDDRADTSIGTVYLPPIGADATQAGGVGHMVIEKAGCSQLPPACLGFGVEVGTFGTGIGSGSGNAGSDGIKQIFRLVRLRMKTRSKVLSSLEVWAMSCDGFSLFAVRICTCSSVVRS